ncbi:MAG: hypothetical protein ACPG7F_12545 [Aggregatilineales bacterium]
MSMSLPNYAAIGYTRGCDEMNFRGTVMPRLIALLCLLMIGIIPTQTQDALNLPTELYVLLNDGGIERYGVGAGGVQRINAADEFVVDFRVAPDDNWLAYRTPDGLFLRNMYEGDTTIQIEGATASVPGIRGQGETIAWSRDSKRLAYTTLTGGRIYHRDEGVFVNVDTPNLLHLLWSPEGNYLAAEATDNIWWIFRREGTEMILTSAIPAANGATWITDSQMIFAPIEGGLVQMDMSVGNLQTPVFDAFQRYYLPFVRDDGIIEVFISFDDGASGRLLELVPAGETYITREIGTGDVIFGGLHFAPGGQWLVAYEGGILALINGITGEGFTLPIASSSAYSWGAISASPVEGFTLAQDGFFMADDSDGIQQVWRLPRDGSLPESLSPAVNDITEFALSPDKRNMVYVSDNSLWRFSPGQDDAPVTLLTLSQDSDVQPVFDATGNTVFYRNQVADEAGIWRVPYDGGESELFVADTEDITHIQPQPATSVNALLVRAESADGTGMLLVNTDTGEQERIGNYRGGVWLRGTQILLKGQLAGTEFVLENLQIVDVNRLDAAPVTIFTQVDSTNILDAGAVSGQAVRLILQSQMPGTIEIIDIRQDSDVITSVAQSGYIVAPQLSPDGSFIAGYGQPGGQLLIYDVLSGEILRLAGFNSVFGFTWN